MTAFVTRQQSLPSEASQNEPQSQIRFNNPGVKPTQGLSVSSDAEDVL